VTEAYGGCYRTLYSDAWKGNIDCKYKQVQDQLPNHQTIFLHIDCNGTNSEMGHAWYVIDDISFGHGFLTLAATGGIVRTMTKDLLIDPKTRGVNDVKHVVTAAASSSSKKSAEDFVAKCVTPTQGSDPPCSAYGSYGELVKDPNVDLIYVGTPHSHHYQNVMLALTNNKPVVCEKAITVNAAQARRLVEEAKKRKLFLMEAAWTRFFPLSHAIRDKIKNGEIGEVLRVSADLSTGEAPEMYETDHRNVNLDLAGGALLDLGVYSLLWAFQVSICFPITWFLRPKLRRFDRRPTTQYQQTNGNLPKFAEQR
jgi:hypothetical protein